MSGEPKKANLRVRRVLTNPSQPPRAAHSFVWTRVGTDVGLDVGYFDLPELREAVERAREKGEEREVTFFVTDRFVLTARGLSSLIEAAKELERDLQKEGLLPAPGRQDTTR